MSSLRSSSKQCGENDESELFLNAAGAAGPHSDSYLELPWLIQSG